MIELVQEYVRWYNEAQHQSGLKLKHEQAELLARGNYEHALYQIRELIEHDTGNKSQSEDQTPA